MMKTLACQRNYSLPKISAPQRLCFSDLGGSMDIRIIWNIGKMQKVWYQETAEYFCFDMMLVWAGEKKWSVFGRIPEKFVKKHEGEICWYHKLLIDQIHNDNVVGFTVNIQVSYCSRIRMEYAHMKAFLWSWKQNTEFWPTLTGHIYGQIEMNLYT